MNYQHQTSTALLYAKLTSFELAVTGQNLNNPRIIGSAVCGSFSTNCVVQYASC